jgi:lipoic acid synthetase
VPDDPPADFVPIASLDDPLPEPGPGEAGGRPLSAPPPRPDWLRVRLPGGPNHAHLKSLLREMSLHTVCEEARCPNIGECFENRTATFMILGRICTRACRFCAVTPGRPAGGPDPGEPARVADAVEHLGLRHVVVTSVARDDLPDGGAAAFAATIRAIRERCPGTGVEVLIPDLDGREADIATVVAAAPDILNHNIETSRRLTPRVRARARYDRTLAVLGQARRLAGEFGLSGMRTKSGFMVGLGESREECREIMADLRAAGCDVLTVGQYLRPSLRHLPVVRYYRPEEFAALRAEALALGFLHCEAGPLVRSSYHADRQSDAAVLRRAEGERTGRTGRGVPPEADERYNHG